jgi:hypothetical protein
MSLQQLQGSLVEPFFCHQQGKKMNLDIGSKEEEKEPIRTFELVLIVRDSQGKVTDKRKSYSTDDHVKLYDFWMRNSFKPSKKKTQKADAAKSKKDIDLALKEVEQHTKVIRRKRKLED